MSKLNKINIWEFVKLQTILCTLVGILAGIIYSFGGLFIDVLVSMNLISTTETPGLSYGTILAFGALIGMPVIFAGIGFSLGIVEAILYNFYTKFFSGFEINISNNG